MSSNYKPLILVADPDPASLTQCMRLLNQDDFNVFTSICRASAISAAQKLPLDLILCDLTLATGGPESDLIEEIYSLPERNDVPVIFTSAGQEPGVIRRQHGFGGAYHIKKPFDPTVLVSLVERSLWMPHLVHTHINRPHFNIKPAIPLTAKVTSAVSPWQNLDAEM